jgi:NADH dehydrogenase FAD-containing subunit
MLFTPLLASTSVGTLEFRSIAEPVRMTIPTAHFHLARCTGLSPEQKRITIRPEISAGLPEHSEVSDLPYDILAIGVGAASNTFGINGVKENAFFMKELHQARAVRKRLIDLLEEASYPNLNEAQVWR